MEEFPESPAKKRTPKEYVQLIFSGFCMGAADIVPGVSGGTMAFILGIYEELIHAISMITHRPFLRDVLRGRWRSAWNDINGMFLLAVGAGIVAAILTLSHTIEKLLHDHPVFVWSFFFGLVLASVFVVHKLIAQWNTKLITALLLGTILAYIIVGLVPVDTPETWWFIILSGAIAICAMILPGISGSFLLVLLGKYEFILRAVNERDIGVIALFLIGTAVGILAFADVLDWLLRRFHDLTVALLIGLMIGSLRRIWPWKESGDLSNNVLPDLNTNTLIVLGVMVLGVVVVLILEKIAHVQKQ